PSARSKRRSSHVRVQGPTSSLDAATSACNHSISVMRYRSLFADSARWDGFEFRPSDTVISTPPKYGTTWVQMLCALLIFDGPDFPAPLDELSPWLDMCNQSIESVRAELRAQSHRRVIKTHTPLDGILVTEQAEDSANVRDGGVL